MNIKIAFYLFLILLFGGSKQLSAYGNNASAASFPYDFGHLHLMADAAEITARYKKVGECLVVDAMIADCAYHDWNGIKYVVFEGIIVRKEADRTFLKKGAKLPFGLAVGDGRALVLKKLLRYRNVAGVETLLSGLRSGEKSVAVTVEDKRLDGDGFEFFLDFDDDDDLRVVGSMVAVI